MAKKSLRGLAATPARPRESSKRNLLGASLGLSSVDYKDTAAPAPVHLRTRQNPLPPLFTAACLSVQQQRLIATAIKNAREMALLPYPAQATGPSLMRRGTDRPFTVIVCSACAADHDVSCSTNCVPPSDAAHTACSSPPRACSDRSPARRARPDAASWPWSSPARTTGWPADRPIGSAPSPTTTRRRRCASGSSSANGENTPVPSQLGRHQLWTRGFSRTN